MARRHLGKTFDIHGGGADLIFPHHENEIAQSCCAFGTDFMAKYWMHNGYLVVEGEKMSKSLGNFITVRELLDEGHSGEAIRLTLLSAQYRQALDFNREGLKQSQSSLDRFYRALRDAATELEVESFDAAAAPDALMAALEDDLNTPLALSVMHEVATELNKAKPAEKAALAGALLGGGAMLGILNEDPDAWLKRGTGDSGGPSAEEIEALIEARITARGQKDFAEADRIRDALTVSYTHLRAHENELEYVCRILPVKQKPSNMEQTPYYISCCSYNTPTTNTSTCSRITTSAQTQKML